jgi:HK97 family phage major capsid protein
MRPNAWAWILAEKDSTGRPLVEPGDVATNPIIVASTRPADYQVRAVGSLFGVPVVLDGNVPNNLGAGTNETRIVVADFRDLILMEDASAAPAQLRFEDVLSATLQIRLLAYGYSAFAAGRQPKAISVISGTGLIVPAL